MAAVNATGVKCASVGADGKLSLTLYNEAVVGMLEQYCDLVLDKSVSYNYQRVSYDITTPVSMFQNGQALYYMQLMNLASSLRDMEADFGILPFPKYDASQDRYYSTVGSWHSVFFCVPAYMEDAERTGAIVNPVRSCVPCTTIRSSTTNICATRTAWICSMSSFPPAYSISAGFIRSAPTATRSSI